MNKNKMDTIEIDSDYSDLSSIPEQNLIEITDNTKAIESTKVKDIKKDENNDTKDNSKKKPDADNGITKKQISLDEDYDSSSSGLEQSSSEKYAELNEALQRKNNYIEELLNDLKSVDDENKTLRSELVHLKDKLSEAAGHIQEQTIIIKNHKSENVQLNEQIDYLKKTETTLQSQLDYLTESNKKFETRMDEFIIQMNSRIKEWEAILDSKEDENTKLKNELSLSQQKILLIDQKDPEYFNELIKQKDFQIDELQEKLAEAANNLITSSKTIELLKKEETTLKIGLSTESIEDSNVIEKLMTELKKWKNQNEDTETCLKLKEMELIEILNNAYAFENDEQGIKNIIQINRKHKQQIKIRDDQIKSLISENNKFNGLLDQYETENIILKKRLNLPLDQPVSTQNILSKYGKLKKELSLILKKQSIIEEQNISLKIRLRQKEKCIKKLYDHLKNQGIKLPEHFLAVILGDENTGRQAFEPANFNIKNIHEIVDSDEESNEHQLNLNEKPTKNNKMDSPDGIGNLHGQPVIRILAELESSKENQKALQKMMNESRLEILSNLELLAKESQNNIKTEQKLIALQKENQSRIQGKSIDTTYEYDEFDSKITFNDALSYLQSNNKAYAMILDKNLKHFYKQFEMLYNTLMEIYSQNTADKDVWKSTEEQYKNEIDKVNLQLHSMKMLFDEFKLKQNIDILFKNVQDENEYKKILMNKESMDIDIAKIENFSNNNNFQYNHEILLHKIYFERKSSYLEESLKIIKTDCKKLKTEIHQEKIENFEKVKYYEMELQKLMLHTADLRSALSDSIPLDIYIKQNVKMNDYQMKYRKILNDVQKNSEVNTINIKNIEIDENIDLNVIKLEDLKNLNIDPISSISEIFNKMLFRINFLENANLTLQDNQNELINKVHNLWINNGQEETNIKIKELKSINDQLKIDNLQLSCKIQAQEEQINYFEQKKLTNDLEINLLSHQILDLQSTNDNKAAIARLSGEIMVSHMHMADIHNKQEMLIQMLDKEKEKNKLLNNFINEKDIQFNNYVLKSNAKISFLSSVLQYMREQYQGAIPLAILDNIKNLQTETKQKLQDLQDSNLEIDNIKEKLYDSLYEELLNKFSTNLECHENETRCIHFLELEIKNSKWLREKSTMKSKYDGLKKIHTELEKRVENLEENLVMLTFSSDNHSINNNILGHKRATSTVELTDIVDDDIKDDEPTKNQQPIPKPRKIVKTVPIAKTQEDNAESIESIDNLPGSPIKSENKPQGGQKKVTVNIQTDHLTYQTVECQANLLNEEPTKINNNEQKKPIISTREKELENELESILSLASERSGIILNLESENSLLKANIESLEKIIRSKNMLIDETQAKYEMRKNDRNDTNENNLEIEKLKKVLDDLRTIESEKDLTINEYQELLKAEKNEHNQIIALAQKQIIDMKIKMETLEKEHNGLKELMTQPSHIEAYNVSMEKYRNRVLDLENKCFQLQSDFDHEHAALVSSRFECERWKNLAAERLTNLERLNKHLEETHKDEVVSYKTENTHWLTELTTAKEELSQTKIRFNEYRNKTSKQIEEQNLIIEGLHSINCNLKQKLLNLQGMMSANDPSFDLGAIIEVDETKEEAEYASTEKSNTSSDQIQNNIFTDKESIKTKFASLWSDSILERVRKEKQMLGRQNTILRKQVKILGSRERRLKLELQNIKAQMSNSRSIKRSKSVSNFSNDNEILQKKIEMLEAQLFVRGSMGNINENSKLLQISLWEKQKRWQESSEKWKQKYYENNIECEKLQRNNESLRSMIQRLEREKRALDSRLSKHSREGTTPSTSTVDQNDHLEMLLQDKERLESEVQSLKYRLDSNIKQNSMLEKIEAQQRKITAFELAERGKDVLVKEYERLLGQNTLLSKQNIKLESEILENQFKNAGKRLEPDGSDGERNCCRRLKQQIQHLENYIKLLREENSQLIAKNIEITNVTPLSPGTATASQAKRISNLEKTVLTLRGLVSKLQADNKRLIKANERIKQAHADNVCEKHKLEIERLEGIIQGKDTLLINAKELLKRAADREKLLNAATE